jgi:hypothetical protein
LHYGVRAARKRQGRPGNGPAFLIEKKTGALCRPFLNQAFLPVSTPEME